MVKTTLLTACLLLVSACSVSLPIDPQAKVKCASDVDCPAGFVCRVSIGLCVSTSTPDLVGADLLGPVAFNPPVSRQGVPLVARFSVSERLARDPIVRLVGPSQAILPMAISPSDTNADAGFYVFTADVTGNEPEGEYAVSIDLLDTAGNESLGLGGDRLRLDFTPPGVAVSWSLEPGRLAARSGDTLSFVVVPELSASIASVRVIDSLSNTLLQIDPSVIVRSNNALLGSVTLDHPLTAVDAIAVEVTLLDAAGNASDPALSHTAWLPIVHHSPSSPTLTIAGKPATGSLRVRVEIAAPPEATAVWIEGDVLDDDQTLQWVEIGSSRLLTLTPGNGNKVLRAKVRDGALTESAWAEDTIAFAAGVLTASPLVQPPNGQLAIKNGDLLSVSGSATIGTHVVSAAVVSVPSGEVVQTLAASAFAVANDGSLSGVFVVGGLTHATQVALELIVEDAELNQSASAASRSLPLLVDLLAPSSVSASVQQGNTVSSTMLQLSLGAGGATQIKIEGNVVETGWVDFVPSLAIELLAGDGAKAVLVRYRDDAHNEASVSLALTLDTGVPTAFVVLQSPWPVPRVKNNDNVTISGAADAVVTLHSAHLVALDGSRAPLSGPGCERDVTSDVTVLGTSISGATSVGVPCVGAAFVAARVVVRNAAGTTSSVTALSETLLVLDNDPPTPGTASFVAVAGADVGFTSSANVALALDAEEPTGSSVEILIGGDAVGPRVGTWVAVPVTANEALTLSPGQGLKNVTMQFRDAVRNNTGVVNLQMTVDADAPSAPLGSQVRITESASSLFDVATVDGTTNTFSIEGLSGALPAASIAELHSGPALDASTLIGTVAVDGTFGFSATALPWNATSSYYLRGRDRAGNSGPATLVRVPRCTFSGIDPSPAKSGLQADGAPVDLLFSCDQALASEPIVTLNGTAALRASGDPTQPGGTSYRYTVEPTGAEPAGIQAAVVRVTAEAAHTLAAPGSVGTDAITTTLDFTPPSLDLAKVLLQQNPPGQNDWLVIDPGAVSDQAGADVLGLLSYPVSVVVRNAADTQSLLTTNAALDGSFVGVNLLDNIQSAATVRLTDAAGNSSSATFNNDIQAPLISALTATPKAGRHGQQITVLFSLTEGPALAASDLATLPKTVVGVRDALFDNLGTTDTSDGVSHSFRYVYTLNQAADAPDSKRWVEVTATDTAGNTSSSRVLVTADFTAPSSSLLTPVGLATWNGRPAITGTASDALSGVERVEFAALHVGSGNYFDGTTFASATPVWLPTVGKTSWSSTQTIPWVSGQSYTVFPRATDIAGNQETPGAGRTFTASTSVGAAPTAFTATSIGQARVRLSWTAPAYTVTGYRLYYALEGQTTPPFLGTGAEQGSSPLILSSTTTTTDVTGLPRGRYVFAVAALNISGRESFLSPVIAAPSRWWKWVLPSPIGTTELGSIIRTSNDEWLVTAFNGVPVVWHSSDGGASWVASNVAQPIGKSVSVDAGRIVAVSAGSAAYSDDDGRTWTTTALPGSAGNVQAIAHTPGRSLAVGNAGKIWVSTNNGTSWAAAQSAATGAMAHVWAAPGRYGAIASDSADAVFSSDGTNFVSTSYPLTQTRVVVRSKETVIAAHTSLPSIARSADGGMTWSTMTMPARIEDAYAEGMVWLLLGTNQTVYRSTDDGLTFTAVALGGTASRISGSGPRIIAVGANDAFVSSDQGVTFTRQSVSLGDARALGVSGENVVMVGAQGAIAYSLTGGTPMLRVPQAWSPTAGPGTGVTGDGTRWFAHDSAYSNAALVRLDADGSTVTSIGTTQAALPSGCPPFTGSDSLQHPQGDPNLSSGAGVIVFAGGGQLHVSVDGGATRRSTSLPGFTPTLTRLVGSTLYAAGTSSGVAALARSLDLGLTWTVFPVTLSPPALTICPVAIGFDAANPNTAMMSTHEGAVYVTRDGGSTFSQCSGIFSIDGGVPVMTTLHGDSDVWVASGPSRYAGAPPPMPSRLPYRATLTPTTCDFVMQSGGAMNRVRGSGSLMVSVGPGSTLRSTDRMQSYSVVNAEAHNHLAFSGDFWLSGGAIGASMSFDNAVTWQAVDRLVPNLPFFGVQGVATAANGTAMMIDGNGQAVLFGPP